MKTLVATAWGETAAAVAVVGAVLVAAALLSYFVVAPEYEKHLNRQFQEQVDAFRRRRLYSRGGWDMDAADSSDDEERKDDARTAVLVPSDSYRGESPAEALDALPASGAAAAKRGTRRVLRMHSSIGPGTLAAASIRRARASIPRSCPSRGRRGASPERLTRRRKSESDALKQSGEARADELRRRVLLRRLEEEIERSKQAHAAQMQMRAAEASPGPCVPPGARLSKERIAVLMAHPADCEQELAVLTAAHAQRQREPGGAVPPEVKRALRTVHDVLSLHLSLEHRDVNKVTVFCNALLRHDGLVHLRALEATGDADVRALATAVIEKAVPAIWH